MTDSTDCPFYTLQRPSATKNNKATGSFTQNLGGHPEQRWPKLPDTPRKKKKKSDTPQK